MKRYLVSLTAALLVIFSLGKCHAADAWSTADTKREIAFDALYIYDLQQNLTALKQWQHQENPRLSPSIEKNTFLGRNASERDITNYFVASALTHLAVSYMLPEQYRQRWQWLSIGYIGMDIRTNLSMGFRLSF